MPLFDIIIVDEAHRLSGPSYYEYMMKYYKPLPDGRMPLVIPMSATMEPILDIINDPKTKFSLPEWLMSEYSPEVNYNLVTVADYDQEELQNIYKDIQNIKSIQDIPQKKSRIKELKERIELILKRPV